MRYPPRHKAEVMQKIVRNAGAMAKKEGFGTTGIDALTQAAGLTSGSFYKHFSGKDELLTALVTHEFEQTIARFFPDKAQKGTNAAQDDKARQLHKWVRTYLSAGHIEQPENGCPIPCLSAEVARADPATRHAYETGLQALHSKMDVHSNPQAAWATLALMVGAVTMARASTDPQLRQTILDACMEQVEKIRVDSTPIP